MIKQVKLKEITSYSKGKQINGDNLIENGAYDYLNGGINPSGKWDEFNTDANTVTISEGGNSSGYVNFMTSPFWCGAHCYYLYDLKTIPKYLYYALKSQEKRLMNLRTGAAMPNIKKSVLGEFTLQIDTDSHNQKQVIHILDNVTEIIQNKSRQLKEYDQLIKSRFVEMFGDVTKKNNGYTINDVCRTMIRGPFGSSLKKEFFVPKGVSTYKVYEQKHAINKKVEIGEYYIDEKKFNELKRFEVQPGDVIMSCSGTIGEFFVIPESAERGIINQALLNFRLNYEMINKYYFLYAMDAIIDIIESKGSGIENITSMINIKNTNLYLPPLLEQNNFSIFVEQVDKLKFAIQASLEETQKLFDSLMQKYFG